MSLRKLLLPFSPLYGALMWLRNTAYDRGLLSIFQAEVPVISVGNISTGGTGKTPLSEYILSLCRAKGIKAAYLSRGYGRISKGYFRVAADAADVLKYGDEALQVAHKFPEMAVAVCEDRRAGIQRLQAEFSPQLILLDDAFQHRKVHRDLNVVLIDASRPPTRDLVLPAGNLREFRQGLTRADLFIVNKITEKQQIKASRQMLEAYEKPMAFCQPKHEGIFHWDGNLLHEPSDFMDLSAIVFSGIGNNAFFQEQLESAGIRLLATRSFRDHHHYREADVAALCKLYERHRAQKPLLLTTEKDICRLRSILKAQSFAGYPFAYLPISLSWLEGKTQVDQLVLDCILSA